MPLCYNQAHSRLQNSRIFSLRRGANNWEGLLYFWPHSVHLKFRTMFFRQTFDVDFFLNLIDATELDRYQMEEGRRGICLVINNYNFEFSVERERKGAKIDEKKIVALFRDELHFEVEVLRNLHGSKILKEAKQFAARDLSQYTKFVFIIMSHGDKDAIEGVDGALVKVAQLMSQFSARECPTLQDKPKLFFIQACRGQLSDPRKDRLPTSLGNVEGEGITMMLFPDSTLAHGVTPLEADFLLSFATAPGYKAWRNQVAGSWFIQVSRCIFTAWNAVNDFFPREFQ